MKKNKSKVKNEKGKVYSSKCTNAGQSQKNQKMYIKDYMVKNQTDKGLTSTLANLGTSMHSKAINPVDKKTNRQRNSKYSKSC